jgi:hypothetical protein
MYLGHVASVKRTGSDIEKPLEEEEKEEGIGNPVNITEMLKQDSIAIRKTSMKSKSRNDPNRD